MYDPVGVKRKSQSPRRTDLKFAEELATGRSNRSLPPQQQHRGLLGRKKRRRKRQKSRRRQQQQLLLERTEWIVNEPGRDQDRNDDLETNATLEKAFGRMDASGTPSKSRKITTAEAKGDADDAVHQVEPPTTPADGRAQQKLLGRTQREEGGVGGEARTATIKPLAAIRAERESTVVAYEDNLTNRRERSASVDSGAAPKTAIRAGQRRGRQVDVEAKPVGGGRAASSEGRGGGAGGGNEDLYRGAGFQSRAVATGESRFRRNRRRKSQQSSERGAVAKPAGGDDNSRASQQLQVGRNGYTGASQTILALVFLILRVVYGRLGCAS